MEVLERLKSADDETHRNAIANLETARAAIVSAIAAGWKKGTWRALDKALGYLEIGLGGARIEHPNKHDAAL